MNSIAVIKPGSVVHVGNPPDIAAIILSVKILPAGQVVYEVGWWKDAVHYDQWLDQAEFSQNGAEKIAVGFASKSKSTG